MVYGGSRHSLHELCVEAPASIATRRVSPSQRIASGPASKLGFKVAYGDPEFPKGAPGRDPTTVIVENSEDLVCPKETGC